MQTMEPRGTSHRRRKAGATGIAIAVALSMGLLTGPVAQAGNGGDNLHHQKHKVDVKLDDAHDEVLAFNKKVASATSKVIDARKQLPAARANLAAAIAEQQRTQRADDLAAQELDDATQEVLVAEQRLGQLEGRLRQLEADVGDFARRAYQMGPFAEVEMVLDAKDPSEFTDRLAAIRSVAQSNNAAMNEMNANRADMAYTELRLAALRDVANQKKQAAEARLQQAQEAARGAAAAKKIVDGLIQQEESALRVAKQHRADVKQQYADLAAEQERIQAKIAAAAARLQSSTGVKTNGDVNAIDNGAQWLFPLPGYAIGSDAGWRMHPILHYVRCHAGADIGAPSGAPIHAVDDGTVIEAGWEGGYGNFTVIAHGGGLTSGYGHQSRIIVHTGEQVKRGQIIGFVGTTGLSTGPHLHLEARINGMPYSPKGWFGLGPKIPVCV